MGVLVGKSSHVHSPIMFWRPMGFWKKMTEATMTMTRLRQFPMECVTGDTLCRIIYETCRRQSLGWQAQRNKSGFCEAAKLVLQPKIPDIGIQISSSCFACSTEFRQDVRIKCKCLKRCRRLSRIICCHAAPQWLVERRDGGTCW